MENIEQDTNTLVDNEVTDIFEEMTSGPEQPALTERPDQPIDPIKISDTEGNNHGFKNETSGYGLQNTSHYQYQEGYNWHPEADTAYSVPEYSRYDQSPNPYNPASMMAHSGHGYPQYNDEYQQVVIGLQPTEYGSHMDHPPSTMDMNPVTITNAAGYGYNQAQIDINPATPTNADGQGYTQAPPIAENIRRECSTQTESTQAPTEERPWFQTTSISRQTLNSSEGPSAIGYIVVAIFIAFFCCMPLGVSAVVFAGKCPMAFNNI